MKKNLTLFLVTILLWGCKKETEEVKEAITFDEPAKVEMKASDEEILEKVYDRNYSFPIGFTYEQNLEGSLYYENTVSIRTQDDVWIELHTNDKKQAKEWSERSAKLSSEYRPLIQERETEKYFEFKRQVVGRESVLSRVHKTSYFIPTQNALSIDHNRDMVRIEVGELKQRPVSLVSAKQFIEYLTSRHRNIVGSKIIETNAAELPNWYQYNHKYTRLIGGDIRMCDEVQVWEYDYFVHKRTGDVYYNAKKIKVLKGKC